MVQPVLDWPDEPADAPLACSLVPLELFHKLARHGMNLNDTQTLLELLQELNVSQGVLEFINTTMHSGNASGAAVAARCRTNCSNYHYCEGAYRDALRWYRSAHGYVALVVCAFGIVANLLNVMVLTRKDLANAPINRILTWLAVVDLLVLIEYVPFAVYMYVVLPGSPDYPWLGAYFVLFHSHFAQVLHTISIFLTITLAAWRFIAIQYPHLTHTLCTMRRCALAILCSFLLPPLVCLPSFLTFSVHESAVQNENATVYHLGVSQLARENHHFLYRVNFLVYSVIIKLLPCCILTLISAWLIKALYRANRRREQLRGYSAVAVLGSQNGNCNGQTLGQALGQAMEAVGEDGKPLHPHLQQHLQQLRRPTRAERRTDRTTRMLLAILVLFLCTEFPQGILGLLSVILGHDFFQSCYVVHGELMDLFALLNGAINFILYCAMSRQFRTTFGQLFKPRRLITRLHGTATSQTEVASTYV